MFENCPMCAGSGIHPFHEDGPCPRCKGHGKVDGTPCCGCGELVPLEEDGRLYWDETELLFKILHEDCSPPEKWEGVTYLFLREITSYFDELLNRDNKVISTIAVCEKLNEMRNILPPSERKKLIQKHQIKSYDDLGIH